MIDTLTLKVFTFKLTDGRKVSYQGITEQSAFNKAREYHGAGVEACQHGTLAITCMCPDKRAQSTREAGYLVCRHAHCAGIIQ